MKYEKMDEFDYLIALGTLEAKDDDVKAFEELDDSDVVLSEDVEKNIQKMIRKKSAQKNNGWKQCKKILSRVAVIILILMSAAFACVMSVSAVREAVWETIANWSKSLEFQDDFVSIGYVCAADIEENAPPKEIEQIKKPTLLPDGAEEYVLVDRKNMFSADYYIDDRQYVLFRQELFGQCVIKIDIENIRSTDFKINGSEAWLFTYENENCISLIWNDGDYIYSLESDSLGVYDLISIAQSVK